MTNANASASPPPTAAYTDRLPGLPGAKSCSTEYAVLHAVARWAMGRAYLPTSGPEFRAACLALAESARVAARFH